jgi:hypothetical protein
LTLLCITRFIAIWKSILKLLAQCSQAFAAAWCEEAVIAHLDKAFGQNVLQKAVDEFFG